MEDVKPIIIPTRFKAKISHELSFPIGAEKISKALSGLPQILDLVLHFKSDRRHNTRLHSYACIRAAQRSRYAELGNKFQDPTGLPLFNEWQIEVFPVPRVHRHRIQQQIIACALPEMDV